MEYEDALKLMTQLLREEAGKDYGYDLYLPTLIRHYLTKFGGVRWDQAELPMRELSPVFYAAAWELCRRGILRPGVTRMDAQATSDSSAGNGYCLCNVRRRRRVNSAPGSSGEKEG